MALTPKFNFADSPASPPRTEAVTVRGESVFESEGTMIGRYKLLEKLGEGGFGAVYVAEQREPVKRRVALKIIKVGMDTRQVVARFEAERQALALMDHANIARVFDAGTTETGRPFFVMELVRGVPITTYCDEHRLCPEERLKLFLSVCQALQHAHQKGIIHRDIKPSNVLVTLMDGEPTAKVIDFGIAKATQSELTEKTVYTQFEQFIGTPAYMSPEQAEMTSQDVDTRSDIYSLGVLLYELLVGKTPFDGKELLQSGLEQMRRTIREKDPVRPSTRLETMSVEELTSAASRRALEAPKLISFLKGDLDWIVLKCLEKDRSRRYETANGLAMDVKRYLSNEPVLARPPSASYRLQKFFRRNKLVATAGIAVVLALICGVAVAGIGLVRERRSRALAEEREHEAEIARRAETEQRKKLEEARREEAVQRARAEQNEANSKRLLYAADMNLAYQAVQMNNLGRARRLLDRHRPTAGAEDLRGWEWRYLWQQCQSDALAALSHRPFRGFSVSFSPDGRRLAVAYMDGRVELWDVNRRTLLRVLHGETGGRPGHLAFAPNRDLLATTAGPGKIKLFDLEKGGEPTVLALTNRWVRQISFSEDGKHICAYLSDPAGASVYNAETGALESFHPTHGYTAHVGAACLSPTGERIFVSSADPARLRVTVSCRNAANGQTIWSTDVAQDFGLAALTISHDGRLLACAAAYEGTVIHLLEASTGKVLKTLQGHTGWVGDLGFSRDDRQLASAAADQSVRLWSVEDGRELAVFRGHGDEVHAVAISPDARFMASGAKDGTVMLWDVGSRQAASTYRYLGSGIRYAAEVEPGVLFEIKTNSGAATLFQIADGTSHSLAGLTSRPIPIPSDMSLRGCVTVENGTFKLFDVIGGNARLKGEVSTGTNVFGGTGAGNWIAWANTNSEICYVARVDRPGEVKEIRSGLSRAVPIRISADGEYLLVGALPPEPGPFERARVFNVATGAIAYESGADRVSDGAFIDGGRSIAIISRKYSPGSGLTFISLVDTNRTASYTERGILGAVVSSPDQRTIAIGSQDSFVVMYDARTFARKTVLRGNMQGVHGVAFSPDGQRLISSSGGVEALKLWDTQTGQELLTLSGRGTLLQRTEFVDNGNALLVGSDDSPGMWQVWRAPSWETIQASERASGPWSNAGE